MRLFQNSGVYPAYLPRLRELTVGATGFAAQRSAFLADRFGACHFLLPVLQGDPDAFFTNGDDEALQRQWACEQGIVVLVPAAREDGLMDWVQYEPGDPLTTDDLGLAVPESITFGPIVLSQVDLIFVPAASVAPDGMRLGWGRGYFDRALGALQNEAPTYAVLYDHELVEDVPREIHDQPVKGAVTPERIMTFA
jgi:5,10-methenyltetrahydrofolate synthetase